MKLKQKHIKYSRVTDFKRYCRREMTRQPDRKQQSLRSPKVRVPEVKRF